MSERSAYCDGYRAALAALEAGTSRRELRVHLNTALREWQISGADIGTETAPELWRDDDDFDFSMWPKTP